MLEKTLKILDKIVLMTLRHEAVILLIFYLCILQKYKINFEKTVFLSEGQCVKLRFFIQKIITFIVMLDKKSRLCYDKCIKFWGYACTN